MKLVSEIIRKLIFPLPPSGEKFNIQFTLIVYINNWLDRPVWLKCSSVGLRTKWFWVRVQLQCNIIWLVFLILNAVSLAVEYLSYDSEFTDTDNGKLSVEDLSLYTERFIKDWEIYDAIYICITIRRMFRRWNNFTLIFRFDNLIFCCISEFTDCL